MVADGGLAWSGRRPLLLLLLRPYRLYPESLFGPRLVLLGKAEKKMPPRAGCRPFGEVVFALLLIYFNVVGGAIFQLVDSL